MDKEYALEILHAVQGTSPSYVQEYGVGLVKEARGYLHRLNLKRKEPDENLFRLIDKIDDLVQRIVI